MRRQITRQPLESKRPSFSRFASPETASSPTNRRPSHTSQYHKRRPWSRWLHRHRCDNNTPIYHYIIPIDKIGGATSISFLDYASAMGMFDLGNGAAEEGLDHSFMDQPHVYFAKKRKPLELRESNQEVGSENVQSQTWR